MHLASILSLKIQQKDKGDRGGRLSLGKEKWGR
jgi:hypothetical protein